MGTLNQLVETFVLNALWQVALVTGLAAASARLLGRAPARYRHVLWVMALVFSLLLPLAAVRDAWKAENHQPDFKLSASTRLNGQQLGSGTGSESPGQESQGLPAKLVTSVGTREGSRPWFVNPLHHHAQPIALPPVAAKTMLCIFLFSLFSQLTRIVRAWRRTRQLCRRAAARQLPPAMAALMVRCQTALGLKRVVLRSSSEVTGPATAGFFRPVIILPESLFETAPSEELASALCHEMAHIRRRDYLANLICELLFLPLAFHPLAWLLKRRIDETRELACDEAAAARLQGAAAYARSLVRLAHSLVPVPLTTRYTLGVFDANILEERIMRLLDKRPQVSGRVARLIFGGTVLVLALGAFAAGAFSLAAVASAPPQEVSRTPADFSGRWELDASQSDLPLPAPANLVEEIDQHGSQLKITTTSKDWNATKPVAVTLFALLDPEFSTTTDNRESVQPFGPGQIRAKTRWEDGNLVTDWQLERSSQVAVIGRWVRHLSPDGMTQTVDISAHDPTRNVDGKAKAVFVKRAHDAAAFLGTWQSEFQGKRFLTLVLREDGQQITGTLSPFNVNFDSDGNLAEAEAGTHGGWKIAEASFSNGTLQLKGRDVESGEVDGFTMDVSDDQTAGFSLAGAPPTPGSVAPLPLVLTRESAKVQATADGLEAGSVTGIPGGVPGGVQGGVVGGTIAGVVGGVPGGVQSRISPARTGGLGSYHGTIFDPSGARVPDAVVTISNDQAGKTLQTKTNQTGEFSFTDVPAGEYSVEVQKPGFAVSYQERVELGPKEEVVLNLVLQPGELVQNVDVTAPAVAGAPKPEQPKRPQRIRVGGAVEAAHLVRMAHPAYPEAVRQRGVQGVVYLHAVISMKGEPLSLNVITSPDPALSQAALDAVKQWRYQPTLLNGEPIEVVTTIAVGFHLVEPPNSTENLQRQ